MIAFVSGLIIAFSINLQIAAFHTLGISRVIPLTAGGQLIGVSVLGILLFGEWIGSIALPVGIVGLILVVTGVIGTTWTEKKPQSMRELEEIDSTFVPLTAEVILDRSGGHQTATTVASKVEEPPKLDWTKGLIQTGASTIGLVMFLITFRWFDIDPIQGFFPQAVGFLVGALIFTSPLLTRSQPKGIKRWSLPTLKALLPGIMWGLGMVIMQFSQIKVGVAVGFSLSQLGVIISTFGGILLLGEKRTRKEMHIVIIGVVLLIAGAILLGVAKSLDV